jgi:chromate transporter
MLPVIEKDIVEKYKILDKDSFMEYATLSQTLPGVIALNCASFVGYSAAGIIGMLVAGLGAVFSSFVLIVNATIMIQRVAHECALSAACRGIRAASSALILSAAFSLGRYNLKSRFAVIVMISAFMMVAFGQVSALFVVIMAGVAGYIYQNVKNKIRGDKRI